VTDTADRPSSPPPPYPQRGSGAPGGDPHGLPHGRPEPGEPGEVRGAGWRLGLLVAGVLALGIFTRASLLVVILALVVMIFFHELGHYLTAKWSGMKVTEFFIGFGPKIWSFRRGETEYGLKGIPAGAYVRIIGMSNLEEVPPEEEARTYRQQSYPKRMLVILAGSGMHFVMALLCIFALLISGTPGGTLFDEARIEAALDAREAGPWQVGAVTEGSAAAAAGVLVGDELVSVAGQRVELWSDVGEIIRPRGGQTIPVEVRRDGELLTLFADIGVRDGRGFFGIGPDFTTDIFRSLHPLEASYRSVIELGDGMWTSVGLLGQFFTGGLGDFASQVASGGRTDGGTPAVGEPGSGGPPSDGEVRREGENRLLSIVGATRLGADLTDGGWQGLALFMLNINIFIGLFNLIPLLPLDGGHAAVATYERIRSRGGRRHMADISRLVPLTYATVMFLILLGVSAMYLDIVAPIRIG
jgi:membrane-associated protease RseP (regulator of RpoE activity)